MLVTGEQGEMSRLDEHRYIHTHSQGVTLEPSLAKGHVGLMKDLQGKACLLSGRNTESSHLGAFSPWGGAHTKGEGGTERDSS